LSRNPLLAKIHIARKELAIPEEQYRALLVRITGQNSASVLRDAQLQAVLDEFRRFGWAPANTFKRSDKKHVRLVFALWTELGRLGAVDATRPALRAFVERQAGVADPEFLTAQEAYKVTEALKSWIERTKRAA